MKYATAESLELVRKERVKREANERYDLACAIADVVSPWQREYANSIPAIEKWLEDRLGEVGAPVMMALEWLAYIDVADHGASPKVIPYPVGALAQCGLADGAG